MKVTLTQEQCVMRAELSEAEPTTEQMLRLGVRFALAGVSYTLRGQQILFTQPYSREFMTKVVGALATIFVEFELIDKINQPKPKQ
ncbi:MAG TPA: hypothetical protein VFZ48_03195 [Candidatus Saccharimonadales bacterium]